VFGPTVLVLNASLYACLDQGIGKDVSGLDRHNKRNLSVFTLKNRESSIHHLLRVLSDLTTRGILVRLLGKSVLIILHIRIVVWLVCLCLCFAFSFLLLIFIFFPFNYLPCLYVFQFSITKSWLLKMWVNQFVRVSFVFLWVLGIDNDEKEDTRSKEIWAAGVPTQKKEFVFFPFLFSLFAFNNQKVWLGWSDKYDALGFMTLSEFAWLWWEPFIFAHKLILGYIESMTWSCENLCLWLYSCLYA